VKFGTNPATAVTVVSGTSITATTPAGTGAVNVVVTNTDTQSGTLTNGYTYNSAPSVTAVSPNSGFTSGGTAVTITGTGFISGATVDFGSAAATNVTVVSGTSITATTPTNSFGTVNVVVTNPDTQSATLTGGYSYVNPAPTVTGISPNTGTTAGGTPVTITGTGFLSGATLTIGAAATNVTVVNNTTITALTTPANAPGLVDVVVTNSDTQSGTLTGGFTYQNPPPTITSISPNSGTSAGGTPVTISGSGFLSGAMVTFGGNAAGSVSVLDGNTITLTTPSGVANTLVDVVVVNTDGQNATATGGYSYTD